MERIRSGLILADLAASTLIVGLLFALLLPAVEQDREAARGRNVHE